MIPAAVRGGAAALRVNGPGDVRFARDKTELPLLACNKIFYPNSNVYITPSVRSARSLLKASADMVAFDARSLPRPRQSIEAIVHVIHAFKRIAVADIATFEEGIAAVEAGADVVATTFSPQFSPALVTKLADSGCRVLAEGQIDDPDKVQKAIDSGAWSVCVGTAITRPHLIASQFRQALKGKEWDARSSSQKSA